MTWMRALGQRLRLVRPSEPPMVEVSPQFLEEAAAAKREAAEVQAHAVSFNPTPAEQAARRRARIARLRQRIALGDAPLFLHEELARLVREEAVNGRLQ